MNGPEFLAMEKNPKYLKLTIGYSEYVFGYEDGLRFLEASAKAEKFMPKWDSDNLKKENYIDVNRSIPIDNVGLISFTEYNMLKAAAVLLPEEPCLH